MWLRPPNKERFQSILESGRGFPAAFFGFTKALAGAKNRAGSLVRWVSEKTFETGFRC